MVQDMHGRELHVGEMVTVRRGPHVGTRGPILSINEQDYTVTIPEVGLVVIPGGYEPVMNHIEVPGHIVEKD